MKPASRIVFNTSVLYFRLLTGVVISLWTTRLVLDALGEVDFGVYSIVGGVVGILGILQGSMTNASMRFMSHSLGTSDKLTILKTFNTTLFLHFVIGFFVLIFIEIGGFLMFEFFLNIPAGKIDDGKIVFHFMALTTFVTIVSVPYDALIFSNENILILSVVDIIGILNKFFIAIFLAHSQGNLLVLYGVLLFINQVFLRLVKQIYCKIKYDDSRFRLKKYIDKKIGKQILMFCWWNLLGSIASVSVSQVRGIFLNIFFGVKINAAYGISQGASSQVNMVSTSMTRALNPQMVKSEGAGNRNKLIYLTELSTKYSVFLFSLFAVPVIIEIPFLLDLWLLSPPEFSAVFCQLILIGLLIDKFTFEITAAIRAVGRIKEFQLFETMLVFLNIPIGYLFLRLGYPPYSIFLSAFIVILLCSVVRLYFGHKIADIEIGKFIRNGISPILLPLVFSLFCAVLPKYFLPEGFLRLIMTSSISMLTLSLFFWRWGLDYNEKIKIKELFLDAYRKVVFWCSLRA